MAHKDWDGPCWYDCWYKNGEFADRKYHWDSGTLNYYLKYKKLANWTPPEPPEPPKHELPDGLYWIYDQDLGRYYILGKREGKWVGNCDYKNPETTLSVDIIARIPIEPVD